METVTLGPRGTYSHRAARAIAETVSFRPSVTAIVEAVDAGAADRGVVPIENSIEGGVSETLDALAATDVAVVDELVTPIRHALLARSAEFDSVASHPQALAQCRDYLDREYPDCTREPVASTAAGVERAREDPSVAAIAHPRSADGSLSVVERDVQDRSSNETRFFVIGPPDERSTDGERTTLVIDPRDNYPGLLLSILEPFADREINLTRIESRPSGRHLGDYHFHLDLDAPLADPRTTEALEAIESQLAEGWVRRLGSYDVIRLDDE